jgi:hypothetical protein
MITYHIFLSILRIQFSFCSKAVNSRGLALGGLKFYLASLISIGSNLSGFAALRSILSAYSSL